MKAMDYSKCILKNTLKQTFINDAGISRIQPSWDENKLTSCPLCDGLKFVQTTNDQNYAMLTPCPGQKALRRIDAYNQAGIPARFMEATLNNYDLQNIHNAARIRQFIANIQNFDKEPNGYLLEGGPGTGKTHLLCAAIRFLTLEFGIPCKYIDYSNLLSDIRASYGQNIPESNTIDPIVAVPVLFIDELGKGRDKANDFEIRIIDEIINRRYLNPKLVTMFASNYYDRDTSGYNLYIRNGYNPLSNSPSASLQWKKYAEKSYKKEGFLSVEDYNTFVKQLMGRDHIEDRVSERTASRILVMARAMNIDASDYRLSRQRIDKA